MKIQQNNSISSIITPATLAEKAEFLLGDAAHTALAIAAKGVIRSYKIPDGLLIG